MQPPRQISGPGIGYGGHHRLKADNTEREHVGTYWRQMSFVPVNGRCHFLIERRRHNNKSSTIKMMTLVNHRVAKCMLGKELTERSLMQRPVLWIEEKFRTASDIEVPFFHGR